MGERDRERVVGRSDELSLIAEMSERLAGGIGGALWIEGEPGIGKTTLCEVLAGNSAARGVRVFLGAASEPFTSFPLRAVVDALNISVKSTDPFRREVADLLRGGGTNFLDPVLAASERILEIVDRECSAAPAVLILEDLQWADEPTLLLWEHLARGLDQIPLMLVGTCHIAPLRPEVARLRAAAHDGLAVTVELAPFSNEQVNDLATRLLGYEPDPALAAELRCTGGNPLYVTEVVGGWGGHDAVVGGGEGHDARRLSSVDAAIRRRLRFLDDDTRTVLRLAALLGREFEVGHLAAATARPVIDLAPVLEQASAAGALAETGQRFVFRHELVRRVLVEEIPAPVRVALHGQVAHSLARSGADVEVVARHLLVSDGTLEAWAVRWLSQIPESAFFVAPQVAAELLTRALQAPSAASDSWASLASGLVAVCFALGRDDEAETTAAQVVQSARDPDIRARMQLYRVRLASRRGHDAHALAVAKAALDDPELAPIWSARLQARTAAVLLKSGRSSEAMSLAEQSMTAATTIADPIGAGYSHLVLAYQCEPAAALEHFETALGRLGTDPDSTEVRLLLLSNRLAALNNLGRAADFQKAVHDTLIMTARLGAARAAVVSMSAAMGFFDFGAWDEALIQVAALQPPLQVSIRIVREGVAALIAGHREEWSDLQRHIRDGDSVPVTPGDARIFSGYLVAARALRAEADGDQVRAAAELSIWLDEDLKHDALERFMWLPTLTRLALAVGDTDLARRAADAAASDADSPTALIRQTLAANLCMAQIDNNVAVLRAVSEQAKFHGWLMLQAAADEEAAARLAASGDSAAARTALGRAVRAYLSVGATFDVRRADARLRAHGVRRGPRSTHRRPDNGWAALTPTEIRVADLVAAGRSNPDIAAELFISRRTAQTHVSRVLRKLTFSRLELIRSGGHGADSPTTRQPKS